MNKANLKPFQDRPKGELILISKKGGQARTKAKSEAAKLRCIKEKLREGGELTDSQQKWILEQLESRTASAANILIEINKLRNQIHPSQRVALLNSEISAHKFIHGEKVQQTNLNMNVNVTAEEIERRLFGDGDNDGARNISDEESESVDM